MANINRNFGKLTGGELTYAPRSLIIDGREIWNPRAETYEQAGYLPVDTSAPSEPAPEGYHYEPRGWEIFDDDRSPVARHIRRVWELVANSPPPPRRWSSLAIKRVLEARGSWAEVKAMLEEMNAYDDFLMADYIAEDDDVFIEARTQAVVLYGGEKVARILDAIPTE
jgi:hypothetical protein